ncbi:MAG: acyltransferase [Dokdonella sp.]|uniref:acyltransferase family protein n=1 Tax=Dokdonella sp. TaxID=2291710 RepID=UPI0032661F1D
MLMNLNTLRAFAALCVVYYHITSDAGLNLAISIGTRGVDVFFVISGFIITYASSKSPDQFFLRRLIRIVPFYWVATLAVFSLAVVAPNLFHTTRADLPQLLCSLFFIPRETDYAGMFPTLILGWSLNYEMYFYALFALSLLVDKARAPIVCTLLITTVLVAINLSGTDNASVRFYARPLVFEFVFGIVAFYLLRWIEANRHRLPGRRNGLALIALVMLTACVALGVGEYGHGFGLSREISAGVPAFFLVVGTLVVEVVYGVSIRSRVLYLIGESSYILYLIHPYVVYGVLRTLFRHASDFGVVATTGLIVALLVVATGVAVALHLWFEKPVMEWLRQRLLPPRTARVAEELHQPNAS